MTPQEFRDEILEKEPDEVLETIILGGQVAHVQSREQDVIRKTLASKFSDIEENVNIRIVGSAKLGFSISEKRNGSEIVKPRYRLFGPDSDIDVAVIFPSAFRSIWFELSSYAHNSGF